MADTIVENQICAACGAEVRSGALFCYNCGVAVASEITVAKNEKNETIDKIPLTKSIDKESEDGFKFEAEQIKVKQKSLIVETVEKPSVKPNVQKDTKLTSAATMRGKSKLVQAQRVEVVWEERESAPNIWFILVALLLTVLAAVILFLAIRLK